jgi:hypothetical protein
VDLPAVGGDRTVTAGPFRLEIRHADPDGGLYAGFADGPRQVRLIGSDGLTDDDLAALVAALRWDDGAQRYRIEGSASGLAEVSAGEAAPSADRRLATVRLRKAGMTDVMVETHLGAPPGTVDRIAASPGSSYRPITVAGHDAVIDDRTASESHLVSVLVPWPDGAYTEVRSFSLADHPASPPAGFGESVGRAEVLAVAESLRPVARSEWDALPQG